MSSRCPFLFVRFSIPIPNTRTDSGWIGKLGARANRKAVHDTSRKVHNWKNHFIFIEVPDSFPLDQSWRELAWVGDNLPSSSEVEEGLAKMFMEFPKVKATYRNLKSYALFVHAVLCPIGVNYPEEGQFMDIDPYLVFDPPTRRADELSSRDTL